MRNVLTPSNTIDVMYARINDRMQLQIKHTGNVNEYQRAVAYQGKKKSLIEMFAQLEVGAHPKVIQTI